MPPRSRLVDPTAEAATLLVRLGIALLAIVLPCGAVLSRRLIFLVMPIGASLILIGVLLGSSRADLQRAEAALRRPVALAAVFLLGWAALSLLWTPFLATAAERYLKTAGTVLLAAAVALGLPPRTRTSNLYLIPIGLAAAALATFTVAMAGMQAMVGRSPDLEASTIDRAAVTLTTLLWPALAALAVRDRWASAAALAVAVTFAAIAVWTPVAIAAFVVAGVVFGLATPRPETAARVLAAIFAAVFVFAPLAPLVIAAVAPTSASSGAGWLAPLVVWSDIVRHDGLRLVTGHGLDTVTRGVLSGLLPSPVPHSLLFEVWYELGALGALATAGLVGAAFLTAGRATSSVAPFAMAGLTFGLSAAILGVSSAQLWWVTLLSVSGIAFALVAKAQYRTTRPVLQRVDEAPYSAA